MLVDGMKAIVVGAGLAGLVAARTLHRAGWEIVVLEASDGVGGRVRTDVVSGFRMDRGFQTLATASPAAKRQLDFKALRLCRLDPGVIVVEGNRWNELGDPFRDLKALFPTVLSTLPNREDRWRALRLRRELRRQPLGELLTKEDVSTSQFLRTYGFSKRFIDLFFRGVFGGIFLDRSLSTSSRCFLFESQLLLRGDAAVPSQGMQAIPEQIAADLPDGAVRLNTPALRLAKDAQRVGGVQTSNEDIEADVVVLASHSPEVERLSGVPLPKDAWPATCLYFALPYPLYGHKKTIVNGYPDTFVNHAIQISNVCPRYAREAEHLLSVTILGAPDLSVEQFTQRALADMQRWFPWRDISHLTALAAYQVPFARLRQPPGFRAQLPANRGGVAGLYFAGEYTEGSSVGAAMASGEKAARAILEDATN